MTKTFIQVGAGAGDRDGYWHEDGFTTYIKRLDKQNVGRILLVEPNPINIIGLRECWKDYPQAEIYNIGICLEASTEKNITFYYVEEDAPNYNIFSMVEAHVRKHYPTQEMFSKIIPCLTLKEFLNENITNKDNLEMLALDIEGIDAEIILENDWSHINCTFLSFEALHLEENIEAVKSKLVDSGYIFAGPGLDFHGYDWLFTNTRKLT